MGPKKQKLDTTPMVPKEEEPVKDDSTQNKKNQKLLARLNKDIKRRSVAVVDGPTRELREKHRQQLQVLSDAQSVRHQVFGVRDTQNPDQVREIKKARLQAKIGKAKLLKKQKREKDTLQAKKILSMEPEKRARVIARRQAKLNNVELKLLAKRKAKLEASYISSEDDSGDSDDSDSEDSNSDRGDSDNAHGKSNGYHGASGMDRGGSDGDHEDSEDGDRGDSNSDLGDSDNDSEASNGDLGDSDNDSGDSDGDRGDSDSDASSDIRDNYSSDDEPSKKKHKPLKSRKS